MTIYQIDVELCLAHADSARDAAIAALEAYVSKKDILCADRFVVFSEAPGWVKQVVPREHLPPLARELLPSHIPINMESISTLLDSIQTDEILTELCEAIMDNMVGMVIE